MHHTGLGTFVSVLLLVTACAPSQASTPTPGSSTAVPISPTALIFTSTVAPSSTPTLVPPALPPTVPQGSPTGTVPPSSPPVAVAATSTAQTAPTVSSATRRPIPADFPLMTFTKTDADGRLTLTFTTEGTFETTLKNASVAKGTFDVSGDRLTFHDVAGRLSCKPAQGDGTYRWSFDGTAIKLQGISDSCGARGATLSGSVWTIDR